MPATITIKLSKTKQNLAFSELDVDKQSQIITIGMSMLSDGENTSNKIANVDWGIKMDKMNKDHADEIKVYVEKIKRLDELNCEKKSSFEKEWMDAVRDAVMKQKMISESELSANKKTICEIKAQLRDVRSECDLQMKTYTESEMSRMNEVRADCESRAKDREDAIISRNKESITAVKAELDDMRKKYEDTIISHTTRAQNSTFKGKDGEDFLLGELTTMFPTAEIDDTHATAKRGDFMVRTNEICMMVETKSYNRNVPKPEIDKFYRDVDDPGNNDVNCALLVSMTTGVCNKADFQLEIRNNKPIMFLHNVETNPVNIQIAFSLFKMLKETDGLDFSNSELTSKLQTVANTIRKEFKKQKTLLDKCYKDQLTSISNTNDSLKELFTILLNIKYD